MAPSGYARGAGGGVEGLEQSIVEFDRGVGMIGRGKARCRARDTDGRLKDQVRRGSARPCAHHIALTVDVLDAEGGIDGRLVGIGGGSGEVVEVEACKKAILR